VDRDPRIRVSPDDVPLDDIRRARVLLLDGHDVPRRLSRRGPPGPQASRRPRRGKGAGRTEELLSLCDHIVAAGHFPGLLIPGPRRKMRTGDPAAIRTQDGYGDAWLPRAFGCDGREEIFSPSIHVEAVDTTGAGDIFHAGFLYALLGGLPFGKFCLRQHRRRSLLPRDGGRAAIPTIEEIRAAGASAAGSSTTSL